MMFVELLFTLSVENQGKSQTAIISSNKMLQQELSLNINRQVKMDIQKKECQNCGGKCVHCTETASKEMERIIGLNRQWMLISYNANYARTRLSPKEWILDTSLQMN